MMILYLLPLRATECFPLAFLKIMYLFLAVLGLHCRLDFSLVVVSGGLLSSSCVWASHLRGFSCCGAQSLGKGFVCGMWAPELRLSSCGTRA